MSPIISVWSIHFSICRLKQMENSEIISFSSPACLHLFYKISLICRFFSKIKKNHYDEKKILSDFSNHFSLNFFFYLDICMTFFFHAGYSKEAQTTMKFVMDTSKYWFKPSITRDQGNIRNSRQQYTKWRKGKKAKRLRMWPDSDREINMIVTWMSCMSWYLFPSLRKEFY